LSSLRLTPNLDTWRPADAVESAVAWKSAIQSSDRPSALVFSRQGLAHQKRSAQQLADIERGGYVLKDSNGTPAAVLIATGSEVGLAVEAAEALEAKGVATRVVSMPCTERFDAQDADYRNAVLPQGIKRFAVEASMADYWYKYVGLDGAVLGMTSFGESAPAGDLYAHFGITSDSLVNLVQSSL
ncbi:MAG: transketolase C-terminal domain-containing protein, partial [Saccharospirillum sp.]